MPSDVTPRGSPRVKLPLVLTRKSHGRDGLPSMLDNATSRNGASVVLFPGQTQLVIQAAGTDSDPQLVNVTIGIDIDQSNGAVAAEDLFSIETTVEWGAGGSHHSAKFDLLWGVNLTLAATYIRIITNFPAQPGATLPITVRAFLAYGSNGRGKECQRTTRFLPPPGGFLPGTALLPIKLASFAREIGIALPASTLGIPPSLDDWRILVYGNTGVPTPLYIWNPKDGLCPVLQGAGFFTIFNASANTWDKPIFAYERLDL